MTCHDSSQQYLKLVGPLLYHVKEKNDIARDIFTQRKTLLTSDIVNMFYNQNCEFYKMIPLLQAWLNEFYYKAYQVEANRSRNQIDYDLYVIGLELLPVLDQQTCYFGQICKSKYRNTIQL